ncbi:MAG TPA: universal stress protein [Thermomicrobiales bacterium]|nr:universal stress protein [Thermomicrobiales bacterium]
MPAHTDVFPTLRVMVLADAETMVEPAADYARSVVGDDVHLMFVPFACECRVSRHALEFHARASAENGVSTEVIAPRGGEPLDAHDSVALAQQRNADLIVVATTCHPEGRLDTSCGAAHLALNSPVPVMLLHDNEQGAPVFPELRRAVVLLDGSPRAAQSLPFASRLARRLRLPVQFVMVIDPTRVLPPAYAYDAEALDNVITDLRETAHWALKQAEGQLAAEGVQVESVLLYGPVMRCIQSAIEPGDVVVMTTHGTGRAPAGTLGSIAAQMIANITAPLVIMRGRTQADAVVEGYAACPWVEPLGRPTMATSAGAHAARA